MIYYLIKIKVYTILNSEVRWRWTIVWLCL